MSTDTATISEELQKKYKESIALPQTEFPMRGNGAVREPEFQANWYSKKVYEKGLAKAKSAGAESFILHDGPPYLSSERIHIGTALNKILKDIVIKYKTQRGFYTPYVPGYDSHGLPIENAVVKNIKGGRRAVSVPELREQCKDFALKNLAGQEAKFKRLGVLGEWENPYVTLNPKFEAEQIRLFGEMAAKGYVYRGLKPVYWSYGSETALADAEVEYEDKHVSNAIYVSFKVQANTVPASFAAKEALADSSVLIWTTTPWTIPGNLAVCLNRDVDYVIAQVIKVIDKEGEETKRVDICKIIVAKDLAESIAKDTKLSIEPIGEAFKGSDLEGVITTHPLFGRNTPVIFGEHVTTDAGTGCVHTAPGHGQEDFQVGKEFGLDVLCPVDGRGVYTADAGSYTTKSEVKWKTTKEGKKLDEVIAAGTEVVLEGKHVIKDGNELVMALLRDAQSLLRKNKITHSYPYCWRSKTPLLYRATEQWFCSVDGFRQTALDEIEKVKWIPERGQNRISSMVQDRGDWCISRQRTWGVPIPALYDKSKVDAQGQYEAILDQEIIEHVAKIFAEEGSGAWYTKPVAELVPEHLHVKYPPENLSIETDTMDVWFDSGSTHRSVVKIREALCPSGEFSPVDLYLEGSDQHRGWFQSSLLTSVATNGFAPYKAVLTHGFVMDEKGRKMSKSLGNVVDPEDVIKKYGADILRLWVASVDYSMDIKVGDNMFKQLSDIYRNFRNTSRYMLGSLFDFDPAKDALAYDELWDLDRLVLHRLQSLVKDLTESFDNYQFLKYYQALQNFCSVELSSFYFDIIKDRLYTHPKASKSRRAAQTVVFELLSVINRLFVPVLPHLADDVFMHVHEPVRAALIATGEFDEDSALLSKWPSVNSKFVNEELSAKWDKILEIRSIANKELEALRAEKVVGKSLEATIEISASADYFAALDSIRDEISAVFIVSGFELTEASVNSVKAIKHSGEKCQRCWKYFPSSELEDGACHTCREAVNSSF